jgi:nicotinamidase/pyrazinamidase
MQVELTDQDVLIVVDVQHDFLPGGALAVPDGNAVIEPINRLTDIFPHVIATQDWHPPSHASFASSHQGRRPFEIGQLSYGDQVLWPDHCVQGTHGAELSPTLNLARARLIVRKGHNPAIDSYSAFVEADRRTATGLAGYCRELGFRRVFCAGLATDFCVAWTALDARTAGFEAFVVQDASRAIDAGGSLDRARADLQEAGIALIRSDQIVPIAGSR